jgi:hypothetical protein
MAYKKTLADNHLSEGALGRFGDTKMHTTKHVRPGSDWHVNPQEKQLMNMYGAKGEKLVDSIGSGTINPYTGKEEKFLGITLAGLGAVAGIGSAVLGGIQSITGGKARNAQAASQARLSQVQIDEATEAAEKLDPTKDARIEVAKAEYGQKAEGLGIQKEEVGQQLNTAIQKSGLVTSAGVTQKKSSIWKRFENTEKGLLGQLGKAMGGIEEWYEGEKSRLGGVIKRATLQKKAFKKQSDSWYLGKNIGL